MRRTVAGLAVIVLASSAALAQPLTPGLPSKLPPNPDDPMPAPAETFPPNRLEQDLIDKINAARKRAGLTELTTHQILTVEAQDFAKTMAAAGTLSHQAEGKSFKQRMKATGYPYSEIAEVVTAHATAAGAADRWMGSPPHKSTILDPDCREIGVATATTNDGSRFWVAILAKPNDEPGTVDLDGGSSLKPQPDDKDE